MCDYINRLSVLYQRHASEIEFAKGIFGDKFDNIPPDARGLLSVSGDLKFVAVYSYFKNKDVESFRRNLSLVAQFRAIVFEKFELGEDIDGSRVSMVAFKDALFALAACDFSTARKLANYMGGRNGIEREHDSTFSLSFGYIVKYLILNKKEDLTEWLEKFEDACKQWNETNYSGYIDCAIAIIDKDECKLDLALKNIIRGHLQLSNKGKEFYNSPEQLICLWGLAFANLAKERGLRVEINDSLIPSDLICGNQ